MQYCALKMHLNYKQLNKAICSLLIIFFRFFPPLLLPSLSGSSSSVWQKVTSLCHMNALGRAGGNNEKVSLPQGNHWKNLCK